MEFHGQSFAFALFCQIELCGKTAQLLLGLDQFRRALLDEGAGWLVRFGHPAFAALKVAGFLLLQGSLALLVGLSVWAVFRGSGQNYAGAKDDGEDDD